MTPNLKKKYFSSKNSSTLKLRSSLRHLEATSLGQLDVTDINVKNK